MPVPSIKRSANGRPSVAKRVLPLSPAQLKQLTFESNTMASIEHKTVLKITKKMMQSNRPKSLAGLTQTFTTG